MTTRMRSVLVPVGIVAGAAALGSLTNLVVEGTLQPAALYGRALVNGLLDALFAVGLVLVYRANRVVSFAQGSLGVIGAALLVGLVRFEGLPFLLALPIGVVAAGATGLAVEVFAVRRLARAPRLALTVVTIGVGQVVVAMAGLLTLWFAGVGDDLAPQAITTPLSDLRFAWSPLVFTGDHLLAVSVAVAALSGLVVFLGRSSVGAAIRAAAQNGERAELLGIGVNNLSSLVWVLAASLSGLAAILALPIQPAFFGFGAAAGASAQLLLRGLAAAVIARMDHLPTAVAAAVGIAVFDQAVLWAFDDAALTNGALLVLIVAVLLTQRAKLGRTDVAAGSSWSSLEEIRSTPHELRDHLKVRLGIRRARLLLGVAVLAYPWVMSPVQTGLGSVYALYGIVVVSLVVLTGWAGQISLGHFAFVAVGGVVGASLRVEVGIPFLPALLLASLLGAGVAVLIGLPALRIQGLFLAVTTLAFAVAVHAIVLNEKWFGWLLPDGDISRPQLGFLDLADQRSFFYLCVGSLAAAYWAAKGIRRSRSGRVLIAMRDNERTAQGYGVNRVRTRLAAFAISGFLASFAGVLLVHLQREVRASSFTPEMSVQLFLLAVIGGLGSVGGALTGVAYLAVVDLFLPPGIGQFLLSGIGVVTVLLFFPRGLGGLVFAARDAWLRRVAMRSRIYVPSLLRTSAAAAEEKATLAPRIPGGTRADNTVPEKYRIASSIGVRGESQGSRRWRYG